MPNYDWLLWKQKMILDKLYLQWDGIRFLESDLQKGLFNHYLFES